VLVRLLAQPGDEVQSVGDQQVLGQRQDAIRVGGPLAAIY